MPASPQRKVSIPRKIPRQARSQATKDVILEAAARVLIERGAHGFTTNHVAARAGVSIGSLYQYYPNKSALLLQLHVREAQTTLNQLRDALQASSNTPRQRLRRGILVFFATEAAEAPLRSALARMDVLFADAPEFKEIEHVAFERVRTFLTSGFKLTNRRADKTAEVVITLVASVAERVTSRTADEAEITRWANQVCDLIETLLPPPVGAIS